MKKIVSLSVLLLMCLVAAKAQEANIRISWDEAPEVFTYAGREYERWGFEGAGYDYRQPELPLYTAAVPVSRPAELRVDVLAVEYEPFGWQPRQHGDQIPASLNFQTTVSSRRGRYTAHITFLPVVRQEGNLQRVKSLRLRVSPTGPALDLSSGARGGSPTESVLRDGQIYKIAVAEDGVYRLTYDFLQSELGVAVDQIDPNQIKLYGNGGGALPESLTEPVPEDLLENAIFVAGAEDGAFNPGDFILFYGQGPHRWVLDEEDRTFVRRTNIYDTRNFYFLQIGPGDGRRIQDQPSLSNTAYTSTSFDDYRQLEEDRLNLMQLSTVTTGSGQEWIGDLYRVDRDNTYTFNFPGLVPGSTARLTIRMLLQAPVNNFFEAVVAGQAFQSFSAASAPSPTRAVGTFANPAVLRAEPSLSSEAVEVDVIYPNQFGESQGWLDYIRLQVRRRLSVSGPQMHFRDLNTLDHPSATFRLSEAGANVEVWDISDPIRPRRQQGERSGNTLAFGLATESLRQFIAFDRNQDFPEPEAVGSVPNQNLHSLTGLDMLLIYHPDFRAAADRLAQHRRDFSGLNLAAVPVDQVYNEFSSGRKDPTAIRNFARLMYERHTGFRYICLLGDGSFDARDIYEQGGDFIPTFQRRGLNGVDAFPTDDYYTILEPGSETDVLLNPMSVAIGRLTVKTAAEADNVVEKIVRYDTGAEVLGDWRTRFTIVADDEDNNAHSDFSENNLSAYLTETVDLLNLDKIYLDAFPQVTTPGGDRFPAATEALNQAVFRGQLAITYMGHGGSSGWAQERVLRKSDVVGWDNLDKLSLFVTATCSFTGYDDPFEVTAGEEILLNPSGGGVALFSTVRDVFLSRNETLTRRTIEELFRKDGQGNYYPLGEILRRAKNRGVGNTPLVENSRKFAVFGDPAQMLAYPEYQIRTTRLNGEAVSAGATDTLRALQQVTIEGEVAGSTGQLLGSFNGEVSIQVLDKPVTLQTLGQDSDSPMLEFQLQKNAVFKGRASVQNGRFDATFVLPKDINFEFGNGRVIYYARHENRDTDAAGAFEDFILGGSDPNGISDQQPPAVDVFVNTEDFVFGGITGPEPVLLVKLQDDVGINIAGNTIGHDLEAVLNEDNQNILVLNDFYEAELDDFTRGEVRYPLSRLPAGRHSVRVKAWDVANNSGTGYTEFVVAEDAAIALEKVLNYPNPFTDRTCFQFDHNMPGQEIDVLVHIYTVSGRLVKTLEKRLLTDGAIRLDNCIEWDGRDDYGDQLARGVYLYRVSVRTANTGSTTLTGESDFQKLVILK